MPYFLRPYQSEAVSKLIWSRQLEGADLCVLPTGSGKSHVIAELANELKERILILQPTKEILEQNVEKLEQYVDKSEIGIYSASVGRKDFGYYTFATIQSIYKKAKDFTDFHYIIIDECHLVNPKNLDGMFTRFLAEIGNPKVVGLTATPYRLEQRYERLANGGILTHTVTQLINRSKAHFWQRIIYNINNQELVDEGYLVPLKYIDKSIIRHEEIPANISKSDFNLAAYEQKIADKEWVIIEDLFFASEVGKSVLVFCSSVDQAAKLCGKMFDAGVRSAAVVTAKTKKKDRELIINGFKNGAIKMVFNVGVLTTGFDHPTLDCIVLLRPTQSIELYYQMLGRGVRPAPGKKHCKVIDLTGTVKRLGRIETIQLVKNNKWELISETGSWHNHVLYSFLIPNEENKINTRTLDPH